MMTIPEILKELEPYTGRFPKKAMQAAIEQREAITPELLRVLETVAENPVEFAQRKDYMLHLFARNAPTHPSSKYLVLPAKRRTIWRGTPSPKG
jgi:hypothetical protein